MYQRQTSNIINVLERERHRHLNLRHLHLLHVRHLDLRHLDLRHLDPRHLHTPGSTSPSSTPRESPASTPTESTPRAPPTSTSLLKMFTPVQAELIKALGDRDNVNGKRLLAAVHYAVM